ncbi:hemolysin [Kosmotoga pacifica]|uniref:Hemolysin n=2 Tax=Kosmotoga pacifica TaxID=1330330 RepID=A0A0G2ZDP3_9BACT|nr:hemolysin [Kosmotoga pacifica]
MVSSKDANEGFNAISHAFAAVIGLVGLILLVVFSALEHKWLHLISFGLYGFTVFFSMTMSSLLHFFIWFKRYLKVLGILDHSAIYLLIAGTYTPFCLVVVRGLLGWIIFGTVWGLALLNIVLKSVFFSKMPDIISIAGYLVMGWLSIFLIYKIFLELGMNAVLLMFAGGLFYTVGALIFLRESPNPFPGRFANHELWHVLVLFGNIAFMVAMFLYVLPYDIQ